jgi:DNA mismatch repair ATPase MutS
MERNADSTFQGRELGHPLIPTDKKVVNDFTIARSGEVVIITGSNMAGKSTFLRTLGVNLCLAYSGGPVNASPFTVSLFRLFTCIKVSDSVTDGVSYFYAEVKRLKALLTELERDGELPLFFLIDEIFRGTNNRERRIGSESYIRALVGRNGIGAISTHDLELVNLADSMPQITYFHFEDRVADGRMVFDYKLRAGPCPTTNALKIMQMEGLPVDGVAPAGSIGEPKITAAPDRFGG